jgi:hypothetical protein
MHLRKRLVMVQDRNWCDHITARIVTLGGVGTVASAGQLTVEDPSAGRTKSGMSIV